MKKLALAVGLLISTIGFAQTYDANFLDGSILFKLKKNIKTTETLKESPETLKKSENIGDYPKLKNVLQTFSISDFNRPVYHTNKEDLQKIYRIKFNNYSEIDEIIKQLSQLEDVEYAEKEPIYKLDFVPNDPNYAGTSGKWYHTLVNSEAAWDISQGSSTIKVAIVDNAVYADHADLTTYKQRDVADNDNDATPPFSNGWSHGTHCAGLATADLNNGVGIASLGGQVELIGIKATPDNAPSGDAIYYGFEGVSWACANGANVVSMSYGGTNASTAMQNLINAYPEVVFLAAAGNDGNTVLQYPGAYDNVICVGSVNGNNSPSSFTNYNGTTSYVDIASPGGGAGSSSYGGLLSTTYNGGSSYGTMSGTSMATPFAAGLVGNMLSINPTMTPTQILNCLISTGVATSGSKNIGPRIDAAAALACVAATVTGDPLVQFAGAPTSIFEGQSVTFVDQSNDGGNTITDWQWSFPGGTPSSFNGQTPPAITYASTGVYTVELTVTNSQSTQTKTRTDYINVSLEPYGEWIIQNSGFATVSSGIGHIDIVDVNTVWAVAYDGSGGGGNPQEFTKTTDGGTNWNVQAIDVGDAGLGISMISAIDDMNAWLVAYPNAAGETGGIWKTTDGGVNWSRQNTATFTNANSFSNVVHFWDANNGFCQGDPINGEFELYTTTDGGTNWNLVSGANIPNPLSGEYGYVRDIEVIGDTVWYGTNKGRLYHSTDKGYNWSVYQTPETDMANAHYSFTNGTTGVLTTGGAVWKTTDAGANWTQLTTTGSIFDAGLCYIEGTDVIFTTGQTGSSYSEDGGVNWNIIDTDQHTYCEFINPTVGWSGSFTVSASEHGIWKWNSLNSNLNADFSATPLIVCIGDTVQFTDLTTGGNITDWSWQFFGGTSPDATVQNPIVTYSSAGQYSVQLTVTDSLGQTTTSKGSYITVEAPAATPSGLAGPATVCQDSLATYACPNIPGVFYVWQLPASWFGSSTSNIITATVGTTSGTVGVAASNVCGVSAFKTKAVTVNDCSVGINEMKSGVLSIYPNPASTTLNISVDNKLLNNSISIIDVLGSVVYTNSINSNIETINISNLSKGMYFVKIEGIDNPIKFIKE